MPDLVMGPPNPNEQQNNGNNSTRGGLKLAQSIQTLPTPSSTLSIQKGRPSFGDEPRNGDEVVITSVNSANTMYIRPCRSNAEYAKNAKDFHEYGMSRYSLKQLPKKDDIVNKNDFHLIFFYLKLFVYLELISFE